MPELNNDFDCSFQMLVEALPYLLTWVFLSFQLKDHCYFGTILSAMGIEMIIAYTLVVLLSMDRKSVNSKIDLTYRIELIISTKKFAI